VIEDTPPQLARRLPPPPQLTRRVGVLGVIAFALFGIIAFRLWYLEVLTGPQHLATATANVQRSIPLPAPRGQILDAGGRVLAATRVGAQAAIIADDLPPQHTAARWQVYRRLARLLHVKTKAIWRVIDSQAWPGYQPAPIKNDLTTYQWVYLKIHPRWFPGVTVEEVNLRKYPQGGIGGAVLGEIGPISKQEVGSSAFRGIAAGTYVGQAGLEAEYNGFLQGKAGVEHVQVNASGYPTGRLPRVTPPIAGDSVQTSLDWGLEREGFTAISRARAYAQGLGNPSPAAAFVAMNPFTGRVLAIGSYPTYNPSVFVTPFTSATWNRLENANPAPLVDRAVNAYYPTGSTFKPITALAGLRSGLIGAGTLQGGGDCFAIGGQCFHNSGGGNYGNLDLVQALTVSEDTYFYRIGAEANGVDGNGHAIQNEARWLGLGRSPRIDLPGGGSAGLVPDMAVIHHLNDVIIAQHCVHGTTRAKRRYVHDAIWITACGQGYYYAPWTVGQNVQLATGQGQFEASPLQMAVAYSAIVNGGTVWRPQIGERIVSPTGQIVEDLPSPSSRHVTIDSYDRSLVLAGLHGAAQSSGGTSCPTFCNFPRTIYGKTGTAVHQGQHDQSWYIAYAPDAKHPIVIAMTVEQGGFGAAAAAPAVRLMLSQWFGLPKKFVAGSSPTL
jgi:penicillin-binding protein 2